MDFNRKEFNRVFWIVLDGVGVGEAPDAARFGDQGADTLGNLSRRIPLNIPHLAEMGIQTLTPVQLKSNIQPKRGIATKAKEISEGKDTTSGHWEMAGLPVHTAFKTFPNGFDAETLERWCRENQLPGFLGNCAASGTEIIERLGPEHMRSGKPIVYTSADSVWQIAAHEETFGLDRLYQISKSARKICDELDIGRVIARPFIGNPEKGIPFKRTYNRKDYAQKPPKQTLLNVLENHQVPIIGVGKISNIFAGVGVPENIDTKGNDDGMRVVQELANTRKSGLIYVNLIDFDMNYGHRRDCKGFAEALESFDRQFGELKKSLTENDLVILTADHGNDPTYRGTDHTREFVPILLDSPRFQGFENKGIRESFADAGMTVAHALLGSNFQKHADFYGTSLL